MRAKPILLLCSAGIVGIAAVGLVAELSKPATVVAGDAQPQVASTTLAASAPASASASASSSVHRAQARVATTPTALDKATSDAELTPHEREAKVVARIDESLTEHLRGERVDPAWARETEASITTTLGGASFAGLRLEAVKCGATMCRVALHADEHVADLDTVLEELTTTHAFRHGGFVRFTAERDLTLFVARKGHSLPPPPRT